MSSYAVGSLVKARGREWVVLPESEEDLLLLRPLGGTEEEIAGIHLALETVEPARFTLPDPTRLGDYRSCRLLRDAVRLGFRSSAGPFRSFARIGVEPRPYQLVPLLLALKLDPVRLLIADDVGIGKTIEAGLIARELIDRAEANRLAVLCPPHLAEQWQGELSSKFHIDAELVLAGTATRLERNCSLGQSLFDLYPYVVVSTDFIKSDRRRQEFLRSCPELVIVDEAHTCAYAAQGRSGRHQRWELVSGLAADANRHLILVTATPHSGKEETFRSLLTLLDPTFAALPEDLAGPAAEPHRRRLAAHFVQRRRADIRHYMQADTPFPEREEKEETYRLSDDYRKLFDRVLAYARQTVKTAEGTRHRQRVRWWSALALLRSLASSPAAAAATLRTRASTADTETDADADEIGRRTILDLEDDSTEALDTTPGSDFEEEGEGAGSNRRHLLAMAREAEALLGDKDSKLIRLAALVKDLLSDGYRPIIFCRFIATADYLRTELRQRLSKKIEIDSVTGALPPADREDRVLQLAAHPERLLVCTDCLSEGINLQEHFDAVVHYDLSWNPTRHEQREGRVDRYGQPRPRIRVLTYYGTDNQIDGIVLDVLIRKHRTIRSSLGISVPVPVETSTVIEAIFEGLLLRENAGLTEKYLPGFDQFFKPKREDLFGAWEAAASREKRSRTMFAQETIKVDEVARELRAVQSAIGSGVQVAGFTREAFGAHGAVISGSDPVRFDLTEAPRALAEAVRQQQNKVFDARFELPVKDGVLYLSRTHPVVEGLAGYVMDTALDGFGLATRCGVIRTKAVERRTTALLARFRYHIITQGKSGEKELLAEECQLLAFCGSPDAAVWLDSESAEQLLVSIPAGNVLPDQATEFLRRVIDGSSLLADRLETTAKQRGEELLQAHRRVRSAARMRGITCRVEPQLPADLLGIYVYLPAS